MSKSMYENACGVGGTSIKQVHAVLNDNDYYEISIQTSVFEELRGYHGSVFKGYDNLRPIRLTVHKVCYGDFLNSLYLHSGKDVLLLEEYAPDCARYLDGDALCVAWQLLGDVLKKREKIAKFFESCQNAVEKENINSIVTELKRDSGVLDSHPIDKYLIELPKPPRKFFYVACCMLHVAILCSNFFLLLRFFLIFLILTI
jgi:hypothetical protein